jgi:hypothetical protein
MRNNTLALWVILPLWLAACGQPTDNSPTDPGSGAQLDRTSRTSRDSISVPGSFTYTDHASLVVGSTIDIKMNAAYADLASATIRPAWLDLQGKEHPLDPITLSNGSGKYMVPSDIPDGRIFLMRAEANGVKLPDPPNQTFLWRAGTPVIFTDRITTSTVSDPEAGDDIKLTIPAVGQQFPQLQVMGHGNGLATADMIGDQPTYAEETVSIATVQLGFENFMRAQIVKNGMLETQDCFTIELDCKQAHCPVTRTACP